MTMHATAPREIARNGDEYDWTSKKARRALGMTSGRYVKRAINRRERRDARLALTTED